MLEKIRGIVLRTVKYGDNGLIVDMFTEQYGRRSFATTQVKGRRGSTGNVFWRPLAMLEFEADIRNGANKLPRPKDVRIYRTNTELTFQPVKSALAMFLTEFLCHALRTESEDRTLYAYLEASFRWLDAAEAHYANFHLVFLMRLSRFLGVFPNLEPFDTTPVPHRNTYYFDLAAGCFCKSQPLHPHFLPPGDAQVLPVLFRMNYDTMHVFRMSRQDRWRILEVLNDYYRLHLPGFPELKSIEILREVFD